MKDFKKLTRAEMQRVIGGKVTSSCSASCGSGSTVSCSGGTGACTASDGVGCNSAGGGNAALCSGVIPPLP